MQKDHVSERATGNELQRVETAVLYQRSRFGQVILQHELKKYSCMFRMQWKMSVAA